MKIILAIILLLIPSYCISQHVVEKGSLEYYEQFRQEIPPSIKKNYKLYWQKMEKCSRLKGDFNSVHFYQYPTDSSFLTIGNPSGLDVVAWWERNDNSIFILRPHIMEEKVVEHEMLHALRGVSGHPVFIYTIRCKIPIYY